MKFIRRWRRLLAVSWRRAGRCYSDCRHGRAHWANRADPNGPEVDIACHRCGMTIFTDGHYGGWKIPRSHPGFERLRKRLREQS